MILACSSSQRSSYCTLFLLRYIETTFLVIVKCELPEEPPSYKCRVFLAAHFCYVRITL